MGGGPGVRVHQFGGGAPRRRPRAAANPNEPPPSLLQSLQSLLPLLLLFILPLLSGLFSGSSTPSGPSIRFDSPISPYTQQHISSRLNIPYYVDPREVSDLTSRKWKELDKRAEHGYINKLSSECEVQQSRRNQMYQQAQGFFFTDQIKLQQARSFEMPSCKRLNDLGYRTS